MSIEEENLLGKYKNSSGDTWHVFSATYEHDNLSATKYYQQLNDNPPVEILPNDLSYVQQLVKVKLSTGFTKIGVLEIKVPPAEAFASAPAAFSDPIAEAPKSSLRKKLQKFKDSAPIPNAEDLIKEATELTTTPNKKVKRQTIAEFSFDGHTFTFISEADTKILVTQFKNSSPVEEVVTNVDELIQACKDKGFQEVKAQPILRNPYKTKKSSVSIDDLIKTMNQG